MEAMLHCHALIAALYFLCQKFLRHHDAFSVTIPLGQFGAQTEYLGCFEKRFMACSRKRVTIYTNAPYLKSLGVALDLRARLCVYVRVLSRARFRLARLKSTLNIETVRRYKDGRGEWKVVWTLYTYNGSSLG